MWVKCWGDGSLGFFLKLTFQHFSAPFLQPALKNSFSFTNIQLGHFSTFTYSNFSFAPQSSTCLLPFCSFILFPHLPWTPSCSGRSQTFAWISEILVSPTSFSRKTKTAMVLLKVLFHWSVHAGMRGKGRRGWGARV